MKKSFIRKVKRLTHQTLLISRNNVTEEHNITDLSVYDQNAEKTLDSYSNETIEALPTSERSSIASEWISIPSNVLENASLPGPSQSDSLSFQEEIKLWAVKNQITHKAVEELLTILRKQPGLDGIPKSARSFLSTVIINGRVMQNSELITSLLNSRTENIKDNNPAEALLDVQIPAKSYIELMELDKKLGDKTTRDFMISKLIHVGGTDIKDIIRRCMPQLVEDEVLRQFSWVGGKGKKKFSLLDIASLIKEVCKKNPLTKNVTEKQVEERLAIFLTKATERCNRRRLVNGFNINEVCFLNWLFLGTRRTNRIMTCLKNC
ncbi:uncharacterized protein LOC123321988 isoform X5 [Coccinella septempunctata]|uniref:uncharacterized protein LOC123312562 isoform X5 n=1 Tax=Coccinella septempunctata TaxID=41139 RepID=UPI001D08C4B7|nr:uncharacterized protein LOC123312562 isoform X5 [Coccinella septempunctata]XP_044758230.1 uncharacterized protein LOC123316291 isoform X5 [Coccinella septempunctata]XP_044765737.1 uncharacterized protein LOC123321988 isoform X5 [Coccinella septempunctata]